MVECVSPSQPPPMWSHPCQGLGAASHLPEHSRVREWGPEEGHIISGCDRDLEGRTQCLWSPHTSQIPLIHIPTLPHAGHRACPLVGEGQ